MPLDGGYKRRKDEEEKPQLSAEELMRIARVSRGMDLLDRLKPGWRDRCTIPLGRISVISPYRCPAAIAFGTYAVASKALGLSVEERVDHGFDTLDNKEYPLLTMEWQKQIWQLARIY